MAKIVIVGAYPESLINFRGDLLRSLVSAGYEVTSMAGEDVPKVRSALSDMGVLFRAYPVQRNGMNPVKDLQTFFELCKAFGQLKPDAVLAYTIKPVIWSGLALKCRTKASFYALIEGIGYAFQSGSWRRRLVGKIASALYSVALGRAARVIFLNPDNRHTFIDNHLVVESKTALIDGIGLDLDRYASAPMPEAGTVFLVIARLLGEKGLREYARAASIVKKRYPEAVFRLVGPTDPSKDGIPLAEIERFSSDFGVDYLGPADDVRPHLAGCHIYVLPSYHEGMPRTVLEAMATGRPILTTDVPGCRQTVMPGENGFLVPKADAQALAERMIWFIEHREVWQRMGQRSRQMAEERFDVHKINRELMKIMGLQDCEQESE